MTLALTAPPLSPSGAQAVSVPSLSIFGQERDGARPAKAVRRWHDY